MIIDSQRISYKISPLDQRYSRKLQENLARSDRTFTDLQTPGWSSIMRSQISQRTKRGNTFRQKQAENEKQAEIYNKLTQIQKLKWSEADEKKMMRTNITIDKNQTKDTDRIRHSHHSSVKIRHNKSKQIQKQSSVINNSKRWNQISVHEYLYENSKKLQNKRMIQKILDDEIKKKQVFKFTPTINKKSIILAQSKFSRVKNNTELMKKQQNTVQTQATQVKQKQDKDVERYRTLNKTFYYLSDGKALLTEQSLQNTLIKIPMPCIKVIQPLITKIYQGEKMQWLDFLQTFNSKNVSGKQGFFSVINKWFSRNQSQNANPNAQNKG